MQVKEILPVEVIQCPFCFKQYTPKQNKHLTKCSYCQRKFQEDPEKLTQSISIIKEKCPKCSHTFKPRKNKDKPVCPKCHNAT